MTPVLPCSTSNVCLIPGAAFSIKKNNSLKNGSLSRKSTKYASSSQRLVLPLPGFVKLFPQYHRGCALLHRSVVRTVSATGTDVAVEEPDSPVVDKDSDGGAEIPADAVETIDSSTKAGSSPASSQSSRSKGSRKSEMPPVKNEDLVPGATFTGKVRSIQPFGAFIDFGAFTDGLVHVSKLSDSFVKDVGSVVSVGQEVKVRLVEANTETGRISLTMRENDDMSKFQQRNDSPATGSSNRQAPRRNTSKPNQRREEFKSSKFVKGQNLEGTVKNLTRSGAFISLPEGDEGFLPRSEESDDVFAGMMGDSSLQIGQEVSIRVLRITRGQVTLTMKKEDTDKVDTELIQGIVHTATNPFVLAFRKNKDISAFLDEREIATEQPEKPIPSVQIGETSQTEPLPNIAEMQDQPVSSDEVSSSIPSTVDDSVEGGETSLKEVVAGANVVSDEKQPETVESSVDSSVQTVEKEAEVTGYNEPESIESSTPQNVDDTVQTSEKEAVADDDKEPESISSASQNVDVTVQALEKEAEANDKEPESIESSLSQSVDDSVAGSDRVESIENSDASGDTSEAQIISSESQTSEEVVENQVISIEEEMQIQTPAAETEITSASQFEDKKVEPASEINGTVGASNGQSGSLSPKESVTKATEFLRKKGLASAENKASRATAEGRIGSYIHDSRIGVLVEVNCETDFVSRGDIFKELVDDLAMQVAACPQVQYLVTEDVPEDILNKEKEIELQKEDLLSKPEQIRSKIVEGRIRKWLEELALLEQPYIKNDKVVVKDWVKQTIATIGENIKVKRFVRYNLGEGLEKKSQDFAAEVAAQTAAKPSEPAKELPAEAEVKETAQKPPAVVVSAALVKQLREETGAGMMDCKKALSETEGDLEKAQEYLRKKGLSAADKKSSRLAAEGRIGSYIHDSRIGVLIEVNCETDFVGRSEKFKELVDDLAMQVVACPQVQFVSIEDIPENILNKEKELEMQRDDLMSKPENIREKIVEGRVSKRLGELALLEQSFIKNDSVLVKDLVKQTVAALGENIKVRRFVRFTVGESTEDTKTEAEA
ncbi:ELONGATION FACTOR TS [Salix viminalis]|uniref:Elongation factor Ts, mitochondrial n=1 Tax=Salix viminalis TaxID=40686 RepID=A0A9Q0NPS2_SALVM|nr:ELONGATION FACTOR TS [Salix viminalis]